MVKVGMAVGWQWMRLDAVNTGLGADPHARARQEGFRHATEFAVGSIAEFTRAGLDSIALPVEPFASSGGIPNHHIYNQFVIRVPRRDELLGHLAAAGIGHAVYYPIPLHLQECFFTLAYKSGDFPESERAARETVALPIYPELTSDQQRAVVDSIAAFYSV